MPTGGGSAHSGKTPNPDMTQILRKELAKMGKK